MEGWRTDKFKNQIQHKSGYTWSKDQELKSQEPFSVRVLTVSNIQKELDLSEELYLQGVSKKDKKTAQIMQIFRKHGIDVLTGMAVLIEISEVFKKGDEE